jgi:hypothetical protein
MGHRTSFGSAKIVISTFLALDFVPIVGFYIHQFKYAQANKEVINM